MMSFYIQKYCQASATIDYCTYEIVAGIPLGYNYAHKPPAYTTSHIWGGAYNIGLRRGGGGLLN